MDPSRVPVSPEERLPILDARRRAKMSTSAHAYVRGTTESFYDWLATTGRKKLPQGPRVWIDGDCHVGNLGPIASVEGAVEIALRDLDQTVIGSPSHDVIRLALSMAMAVRASALPGAVTAKLVDAIARGYERVLEARASRRETNLPPAPSALAKIVHEAARRSRSNLLKERLGGKKRRIPIGNRYWPLSDQEHASVAAFFATKKARELVTALTRRPDTAHVELLDAAYWVKGCSSLGLWRCAAIVEVAASSKKETATLALIDIKEARPGLAPRAPRAHIPKHQGERVVAGAEVLSPSLGSRMCAAKVADKEVFVRELLPQDLKFDLDRLDADEALEIGSYLASVVADAHARQLDSAQSRDWLVEFRRDSGVQFAAPPWLWESVVDLVAVHEGAYLRHCRRYALGPPVSDIAALPDIVLNTVTGD